MCIMTPGVHEDTDADQSGRIFDTIGSDRRLYFSANSNGTPMAIDEGVATIELIVREGPAVNHEADPLTNRLERAV